MTLAQKFRLSYGELVSLKATFDVMTKYYYYFVLISEILLRMDINKARKVLDNHWGYTIVVYILNIMHEMKDSFIAPPTWFNNYNIFDSLKWET